MIMTLVYTFTTTDRDLLMQALVFILIFSHVALNLIFLAYFLKAISPQPDFIAWCELDPSHSHLYHTLIVLCSVLSFQCIRVIYSRLMGLPLFFGKFNTSLIFKPLNYFTIAYLFTCGFSLLFLSVRNIIAQEGYRTSVLYSSI